MEHDHDPHDPPDPLGRRPRKAASREMRAPHGHPAAADAHASCRTAHLSPLDAPAGGRAASGAVELIGLNQRGRLIRLRDRSGTSCAVVQTLERQPGIGDAYAARVARSAALVRAAREPRLCSVSALTPIAGGLAAILALDATTTLAASLDAARRRREGGPSEASKPSEASTIGACSDAAGAARLVAELARAVHAAHERGLVHGALEPGAVLLRPGGLPVITGFELGPPALVGLQSVLSLPPALDHAASYWAPELVGASADAYDAPDAPGAPGASGARGARGATGASRAPGAGCATGASRTGRRVDVYALGVLLYEMLTLERPFDGEPHGTTLLRVLAGTFRRPRARDARIPVAIERVCLRAMAHRPERRFDTALAYADALAEAASRRASTRAAERDARASGRAAPASGRAARQR